MFWGGGCDCHKLSLLTGNSEAELQLLYRTRWDLFSFSTALHPDPLLTSSLHRPDNTDATKAEGIVLFPPPSPPPSPPGWAHNVMTSHFLLSVSRNSNAALYRRMTSSLLLGLYLATCSVPPLVWEAFKHHCPQEALSVLPQGLHNSASGIYRLPFRLLVSCTDPTQLT